MRNGIFGLLVGLILFTSVSIGLSLEPGLMSELFIDILILSATCLSVLVFIFSARVALIVGFISPDISSGLHFSAFIAGCIGECSWTLGVWFLLFKYWQMAYELQYLFCRDNEQRD